MEALMTLSWKAGGLLLGLVFFAAVALVKPIGVSTQFVILDGILWDAVSPDFVVPSEEAASGWTSGNRYIAASGGKYAAAIADPLDYSFVFVAAMLPGAFASGLLRGGNGRAENRAPAIWRANFGDAVWPRYAAAFFGGVLVLFGARLAGGCTSGHMMSGIMQTSVSGYVFAAGAFAAAVPTALLLFSREA
jgi:hypothetical protein